MTRLFYSFALLYIMANQVYAVQCPEITIEDVLMCPVNHDMLETTSGTLTIWRLMDVQELLEADIILKSGTAKIKRLNQIPIGLNRDNMRSIAEDQEVVFCVYKVSAEGKKAFIRFCTEIENVASDVSETEKEVLLDPDYQANLCRAMLESYVSTNLFFGSYGTGVPSFATQFLRRRNLIQEPQISVEVEGPLEE